MRAYLGTFSSEGFYICSIKYVTLTKETVYAECVHTFPMESSLSKKPLICFISREESESTSGDTLAFCGSQIDKKKKVVPKGQWWDYYNIAC